MRSRHRIFIGVFSVIAAIALSAPVFSDDTGVPEPLAVKWQGNGLRIELQPLSGDLTRAFFIGRGFVKKDVEFLATEACVFRSDIGHASASTDGTKSDTPTILKLEKWRVIKGEKVHPLRTREMWKDVWSKRSLDPTASVAFHWALIPTSQTYQPTDYNWGLLTFMEKPGTKFDLEIAWLEGDKSRTHIFNNLKCGK